MNEVTVHEIRYSKPKVTLLQHSGVGVAEMAARTCYDSFENSENSAVKEAMQHLDKEAINQIDGSELLHSLAWVHHHHSIMEHATLSYLVQGTSRGVLQEHARHRIQAISVRSTRYTMGSVLNAYVASFYADEPFHFFMETIKQLALFVIDDEEYIELEIKSIYDKLNFQKKRNRDFTTLAIAKSSLGFLNTSTDAKLLFEKLENGKKKRNVGDAFKHIVTDNWKVDMVITFNIRSLKNYFELRDSGAAWFQIRWLAEAMKEVTPTKYLKLIDKNYK
jgi:thymidylate synthase (FAD)